MVVVYDNVLIAISYDGDQYDTVLGALVLV